MKLPPPTVKLNSHGMVFNVLCVRLMPDIGYIQLWEPRENPTAFYIVPCKERDEDRIPWRANCGEKIYPRKYKDYGGYFYELCRRMKWFTDCTYTVEAKAAQFKGDICLLFDLETAVSSNALFGSNFILEEDGGMEQDQEYLHIYIAQLEPFADHRSGCMRASASPTWWRA